MSTRSGNRTCSSYVFKGFTVSVLWLSKRVCCPAQYGIGNGRTLRCNDCKIDEMLACLLCSLYGRLWTRLAYEVRRVRNSWDAINCGSVIVKVQGADYGYFGVSRHSTSPFEENHAGAWRDGRVVIYCFCLVLGFVGHSMYVWLSGDLSNSM